MTLSAANENVLMAVDACEVAGIVPSIGRIVAETDPRLDFAEVATILRILAGRGYLHLSWHPASDQQIFELTDLARLGRSPK